MRKVLIVAATLLLAPGVYAASAFKAAYEIREAVRLGDVATLQHRVDWAGVRQSLKRSQAETRQLMSEMSEAAGVPKLGIWDRVKAAAAPFVADPLIDRYVTAEGAPKVWAWRQTWRQKVRPAIGLAEPPTLLSSTFLKDTALDRSMTLIRRVDRFAFRSATRLELELADRYIEGRQWHATLELSGWTWKLTEVHLRRKLDRPGQQTALQGK